MEKGVPQTAYTEGTDVPDSKKRKVIAPVIAFSPHLDGWSYDGTQLSEHNGTWRALDLSAPSLRVDSFRFVVRKGSGGDGAGTVRDGWAVVGAGELSTRVSYSMIPFPFVTWRWGRATGRVRALRDLRE
uniref:Uncharacterized protein n=1 Tax=Branchiostoma floridae TaxID=7739 RepID=C3Z8J6_BRAFL|eukprot:XP_002595090.1 hypothetical protein BRAFLDRAFT_90200 [Branchiostoma floridae]